MRPFKIIQEKCSLHDALTVLRFTGSLDAERVQTVAERFEAAMTAGNVFIVADMSDVSFISSPVLGELMGCKKRLSERGGSLFLVGLDTENRTKLRLMGAEKIFEFLPSISAAVRKYHWENEDSGDAFQIRIPPFLSYVPEMRILFSGIVRIKGYSKRDAFRVEAIIDELVNNAIEHGFGPAGGPIEVSGKVYRYRVEITITNTRKAGQDDSAFIGDINNRLHGDLPFNLNEKRGRGIELVKMLCDEFSITAQADKTIVRIIKKKEV
ncbi:MAG: STAS domain-containing protein [Fibrobacterota bacterium]